MLLGTLGDFLLGNVFAGNKVVRVCEGAIATSQERGTFRGDRIFNATSSFN